jgi:hypothetical protein
LLHVRFSEHDLPYLFTQCSSQRSLSTKARPAVDLDCRMRMCS